MLAPCLAYYSSGQEATAETQVQEELPYPTATTISRRIFTKAT